MNDFGIENLSTKIIFQKSREYFKEVYSSYFNNNHRASIVTLYSVVISDILLKLEYLDDIYSDQIAKSILDEVKRLQISNPISSEWERELIEKVRSRTTLIDNVDYAHFLALRSLRHLCAHPVIDKDEKLYTPNKETVASHVRNMLESFLSKPAVLSKKIFSTILEDIASKRDLLIDDVILKKYLQSKYLGNLNATTEVSLFREFWKFVFRLNDQKTSENRLIIFRTLNILYQRNSTECIAKIKSEIDYFSNITDDKNILNIFIIFISKNEFLYDDFKDDIKIIIDKHVSVDVGGRLVAWFLNGSFPNHLDSIMKVVENGATYPSYYDASMSAYDQLLKIGYLKGHLYETTEFVSWRYTVSRSYNDADNKFTYLLKPNLDRFTNPQLIILCEKIDDNSQVYSRNQASTDHEELRLYIESRKIAGFRATNYKHAFAV